MDETFIGGKARNMHKQDKIRKMKGKRGGGDGGNKTIVLGMIERAAKGKQKRVRTTILADRKAKSIRPEIEAHVEPGTTIYSDEFGSSWANTDKNIHEAVNHLSEYVRGTVHTNSAENFWSLLKRAIGGTYIAVEPFHLFRYADEQAFRFNNRLTADGEAESDFQRFNQLVKQILGKRLTYVELTGGERPAAAF